jgi:hypothetical protein
MIPDIVLTKQHISAFLRTKQFNARHILKNNIATYLISHTNSIAGPHTLLSDYLNEMLARLLEGVPLSDEEDKLRG